MTDWEKAINLKPLNAYECLDYDLHNKMLPGFNKTEDRENFRRFNRKGNA